MHFNAYGLLIALGVLVAVVYMSFESKRLQLPDDLAMDMALWAVPPAILFSRLYFVAFTWERYKNDLLSILYVWEGGLAIYGGVIGGALGVYLLSRHKKIAFATLADLVAPGLLMGQAIGRWGNFFNGEAYGTLITNPRLQFFPLAVFADGQWHMATFLYESLWNVAGVLFLLALRHRFYQKGRGFVFLWYLIWYGLGRMVIEGLRTDSLFWGSLRVSQGLSILLVVAAGLAICWRLKLPFYKTLPLLAGLVLLVLAAFGLGFDLVPGFVLLFLAAGWLLAAFLPKEKQDSP